MLKSFPCETTTSVIHNSIDTVDSPVSNNIFIHHNIFHAPYSFLTFPMAVTSQRERERERERESLLLHKNFDHKKSTTFCLRCSF